MSQSNNPKNMFFRTQQNKNKSTYHPNVLKIEPQIKKIYAAYCEADSSKQQVKSIWKLIKLCHNNAAGQGCLVKILNLPGTDGPISLNALPSNLLEHNQEIGQSGDQKSTQLQFLFDFLKNIEQNYFCWIIYYSQELKILNLKLLRQDQLEQFESLFNPNLNLIGIFTKKQKPKIPKQPTAQKLQNEFNEGTTLYKKHAISTPNNSTGSSWKNPQQEITQIDTKTSQFKFRSISPKFKMTSKTRMLKKPINDFEKSNKSLSVMSKVSKMSKSQSIFQRVNLVNDSNKFSSTLCLQQNKQIPLKIEKKVTGSTKLKKESKFHRVQRIYQKGV